MDYKNNLIAIYGGKEKPKKSLTEICNYLETELDAISLDFELVVDPMRKFLFYNIEMYIKSHNMNVNISSDDIILYVISKDGKGKRYYEEKHTLAAINGYRDYIYVILVKKLDYYMECNCDVMFIDIAIERGISEWDRKNQSLMYMEYLSRIEFRENNYYKNGVKKE